MQRLAPERLDPVDMNPEIFDPSSWEASQVNETNIYIFRLMPLRA